MHYHFRFLKQVYSALSNSEDSLSLAFSIFKRVQNIITMAQGYDFLVGTFNTPQLYTLRFIPPSSPSKSSGSLKVLHRASAVGSHSWLHLSPPRPNGTRNLYATAWTEPPSVVAYAVDSPTNIRLLGSAPTGSRSGYVTASEVAVYSAGGATGEVRVVVP